MATEQFCKGRFVWALPKLTLQNQVNVRKFFGW
jgi:hypothetical protein